MGEESENLSRDMIHLILPCPSSDSRFVSLMLSGMEDLLTLVFFMASHPLQLAYIFFFSRYIIRMLSLLFPLLLTTCLFLLLFLTVDGSSLALPEFLGRTCKILLESLKHEVNGDFSSIDNEVGDVRLLGCFFSNLETCIFDCVVGSNEEERMPIEADDDGNSSSCKEEIKEEKVKKEGEGEGEGEGEENEVNFFKPTFPSNGIIGWDEFEAIGKLYKALTHEVGVYPIKLVIRNLKRKQLLASKHENAYSSEEVGHLERWETPASNLEWHMAEFDVEKDGKSGKGIELGELVSKSLERYESAWREMEWKKTLASKLYQERWSAGAAKGELEGMDLLWEETNEVASYVKDDKEKAIEKRSLSKKKSDKEGKKNKVKDEERNKEELKEEDDEDEDEEEKDIVGHICCLQALKFPRGRMSFGLGKVRKLVKTTKAFKAGMGIFHNISGKNTKKP